MFRLNSPLELTGRTPDVIIQRHCFISIGNYYLCMWQISGKNDIDQNFVAILWLSLITSTKSLIFVHFFTEENCWVLYGRNGNHTKRFFERRVRLFTTRFLGNQEVICRHRWSSFGRCTRAFRAWKITFQKYRRNESSRLAAIRLQQNSILIHRCFKRWIEYIHEQRFEREIDERVDVTWAKIQKWLI